MSALRLEDGELLIVISDDSPSTAIADYAQRWGIETLFGMLPELRSLVVRCSASEFALQTWTRSVRDDDLRVCAAPEAFV